MPKGVGRPGKARDKDNSKKKSDVQAKIRKHQQSSMTGMNPLMTRVAAKLNQAKKKKK